MPEVGLHSLSFRKWSRRWRSQRIYGGRLEPSEVTTWVQPTAQIDRDWRDDDRLIWGYTADSTTLAGAGNLYPGVMVLAGPTREVVVRCLEASLSTTSGGLIFNGEFHVFTPWPGYNPVINGPGSFFPFLQTRDGDGLTVPDAQVIGGLAGALPSVIIGGVLVNPAIGPRYIPHASGLQNAAIGFYQRAMTRVLDWSDPPIIIAPNQMLAVQGLTPFTTSQSTLWVNAWLSEREAV